jgi:hypothetical protein
MVQQRLGVRNKPSNRRMSRNAIHRPTIHQPSRRDAG